VHSVSALHLQRPIPPLTYSDLTTPISQSCIGIGGESAVGQWVIEIYDNQINGNSGYFTSWALEVQGMNAYNTLTQKHTALR
jgi:subtilisin-like proprotein convertase family protein